MREHIAKAAPALHAAGNRRYLALLHSLSGVVLAQGGRIEEAMAALRQAERLAAAVQAQDVLGIICNNQANVALIQHRHEQALTLAERSAALQEQIGPGRGLAISLATLGQILVRLGELERAEEVLHRALQVRRPIQFHEITGAVFDTLAQIALMRGGYERPAITCARPAKHTAATARRRASGTSGRSACSKPSWRRARARSRKRCGWPTKSPRNAPPAEAIQADLIACEALLAADRAEEAETRLGRVAARIDARAMPGAWGEFLRLRGALHAAAGRLSEAYHDIAQSASVFELVGEGYQSALSHLALGQLAAALVRVRRPSISSSVRPRCSNLSGRRAISSRHGGGGRAAAGRSRRIRRRPSMPMMRSSAGWWTPPLFPNFSGTKQPPPSVTPSMPSALSCSSRRRMARSGWSPGAAATPIARERSRRRRASADARNRMGRLEPDGRDSDGPRHVAFLSSRPMADRCGGASG